MLLVAAIASGQGKTTVTAALARRLRRRGQRVHVFKCGPDFIDPMVLEHASGAKVHTLDLWMVGLEQSRQRLARAAREADVVLIEGVMGLYDGDPSAADLARAFDLPVLAVIDASAMAQTAGAVVMGLRDYGPVRMAGVVANRVASEGHARMVAASLRDIPLLATLPKQARQLPERHLGLVVPGEVADIDAILDELADQLQVDEAQWNALAPQLPDEARPEEPVAPLLAGTTVAIARDAAFCFLYPANVDTLEALGARIVWSFAARGRASARKRRRRLPAGRLPGTAWRNAGAGRALAIVDPCGARFRLAHPRRVRRHDGAGRIARRQGRPRLAHGGLLPGRVLMQPRLAGLGSQGLATNAGQMRGHTFHYSRLETPLAPVAWTVKHPSGAQGEAVYRTGSLTASYFHAFFASNPAAVASLLRGELA
jgi:cobyrinic acid a,c-diamide synthase